MPYRNPQSPRQASAALSDIKSDAEFTRTIMAAQNDYRNALDELQQWAQDKAMRSQRELYREN